MSKALAGLLTQGGQFCFLPVVGSFEPIDWLIADRWTFCAPTNAATRSSRLFTLQRLQGKEVVTWQSSLPQLATLNGGQ